MYHILRHKNICKFKSIEITAYCLSNHSAITYTHAHINTHAQINKLQNFLPFEIWIGFYCAYFFYFFASYNAPQSYLIPISLRSTLPPCVLSPKMKKRARFNLCCSYTHGSTVKLPVISLLKITEFYVHPRPATVSRSPQVQRATLQHLYHNF